MIAQILLLKKSNSGYYVNILVLKIVLQTQLTLLLSNYKLAIIVVLNILPIGYTDEFIGSTIVQVITRYVIFTSSIFKVLHFEYQISS